MINISTPDVLRQPIGWICHSTSRHLPQIMFSPEQKHTQKRRVSRFATRHTKCATSNDELIIEYKLRHTHPQPLLLDSQPPALLECSTAVFSLGNNMDCIRFNGSGLFKTFHHPVEALVLKHRTFPPCKRKPRFAVRRRIDRSSLSTLQTRRDGTVIEGRPDERNDRWEGRRQDEPKIARETVGKSCSARRASFCIKPPTSSESRPATAVHFMVDGVTTKTTGI